MPLEALDIGTPAERADAGDDAAAEVPCAGGTAEALDAGLEDDDADAMDAGADAAAARSAEAIPIWSTPAFCAFVMARKI